MISQHSKTKRFYRNWLKTARSSAFVILGISAVSGGTANAGPLGYQEGRTVLKVKTSYFSTQANYTDTGLQQSLIGDSYLRTITTTFSATHDFTDGFSAYALLDTTYAQSQDRSFQRTRLIPTDLKLGTDFSLVDEDWGLVPEVQVNVPLTSVSETTDEIVISDGALEARAGAYLSSHFDFLSGYLYGGYAYRGNGLSSLFPYELQLVKALGSTQISLGVWGHESLTEDQFTNQRTKREAITNRVNGGSLRFYSINPSVTEAGGSFGLPIGDSLFLRVGAQTTLRGKNTAQGSTFWLSLSTNFSSSKAAENRKRTREEQKRQEQKRREFVPETYEDEVIFQQEIERQTTPSNKKTRPEIIPSRPSTLSGPGETRFQESSAGGPPVDVKLRSSKPKKKKRKSPSR